MSRGSKKPGSWRTRRHLPSQPVVVAPRGELSDRMFSRAAGAQLISGNQVRVLVDGRENYPAWLAAIRSAQHHVHFENYFVQDDDVGRELAAALSERARAGVQVRVLYDWMGGFGKARRRFWRELEAEGVEVRVFNPPRLSRPLGWLSRDHRKTLAVDGEIGFVTGLCVGWMWVGDPARDIEPWRDTGVQIRGPAVAEIERAFATSWAATGAPLPRDDAPQDDAPQDDAPQDDAPQDDAPQDDAPQDDAPQDDAPQDDAPQDDAPRDDAPQDDAPQDDARQDDTPLEPPATSGVAVRIVSSAPGAARMLRLDQLVASMARKRLWLTDAYYSGTASYAQALRAAAHDGVDVRLLVPNATDLPLLQPFSRAGYRTLLEAGVRVFEWNGSMLHAKTAVADSRWARVGSTNLNVASWLNNLELDAVIEDEAFAAQMDELYLRDLQNSTEVVLDDRRKLSAPRRPPRTRATKRSHRGSSGAGAVAALRLGNAFGAALTKRKVLGPAEARLTWILGCILCIVSLLVAFFPQAAAYVVSALGLWGGGTLLVRAIRMSRKKKRQDLTPSDSDDPTLDTDSQLSGSQLSGSQLSGPQPPSSPKAGSSRERERLAEGEVTYARLGDSVVTGQFTEWLIRGGTYGDETSRSWEWALDGAPLTVLDESDAPYVLPTDNALLDRLEQAPLQFQQVGPTTWSTRVSTYYSHHLGSVSSHYEVTIDTNTRVARVISLKSDVDLD